MLEYLIIGAGPAGLQLGYFFHKGGRNYQILEGGEAPGTFFGSFPRHRTLISINKIHTGSDDPELNLRWDWNSLLCDDPELNLGKYSEEYFPPAESLLRYLADYAERYQLDIRYNTRVEKVGKLDDGSFVAVDTDGNEYRAQRLIVATGLPKPYLPPTVQGIELAELYHDVSVDPQDFIGQRVLVIGKGNSGFETADNLLATTSLIHVASPNRISMAWKTHYVGHLRAVNNNLLDSYQLKSQNAVIDAQIKRIEKEGDGFRVTFAYAHANGETEDICYDRVIACTGFRFDDSIFDENCRPELVINDRFPGQTSAWESTNIEGLYFAGVVTQVRDYKKSTSAFIHGFRYNARALYRILGQRFHGEEWPHRKLPADPEAVRDVVIERINRTSALWQQFGFLCDVIMVGEDGSARYYEEVPLDYVREGQLGTADHYYTVTLEYGSGIEDPFNAVRIERNDFERAEESKFLHPIVRRYRGVQQVAEHHVIEDLEAHWMEPIHTEPLYEFLDHQLEAAS